MEAGFTGAPIDAKTHVSVVAVEEDTDEDITAWSNASKINKASYETEIYFEEELKTKSYQEKLNICIEIIQ